MTELALDAATRVARAILADGLAPACAVAVTDRERTLAARVEGDAAPGALWELGSIGKSFTAACALQLAEEGMLDLHAPVTAYLPWFSVRGGRGPITLHHLLTHTAGLIRGADLATASNYDAIALAETEVGFAPGEHFWYSNVGYRVVGLALEAVSGLPYQRLVRERVLEPLGMARSIAEIVHDTRPLLAPAHVPFYDDRPWRPEHGLVPATWIESAEADGSVCCPIDEAATYARALLNGGEGILSPAAFRALGARHVVDEQDGGHYGYALVVADDGFGHGGGMIGHVAHLWVDRERGLGVVAGVNGLDGARRLAEAALADAAGRPYEDPGLELAEPLLDDGSAPAEWRPYLGHYRSHNPWLSNFRVCAREGALVLGSDCLGSERHPLTPLGEAVFRVGEQAWSPERLRLETLVDGRCQRAYLSGAPYYRAFTP